MVTELSRIEFTTVIAADQLLTSVANDTSVSLTVMSAPGPPGLPGMPGPSGIDAEVSTDFALIYHLST
ncbi:MAG: hypothetical protein RLZZ09_7 [Pseudomonadota bacterium]|jgi:hypothetical protein